MQPYRFCVVALNVANGANDVIYSEERI